MAEVRSSGLECQAATAQERPRGATLRPRSGAAAKRSCPVSKVSGSGWEELPHVRGQWRPGGDTPPEGGGQEKPPRARGQGR